jgi:hypothetical protein
VPPGEYLLREDQGEATFSGRLEQGCLRFRLEVPPEGCLVLELVERSAAQ